MTRKQCKLPLSLLIYFSLNLLHLGYIIDLTISLGGKKLEILESIEDNEVDVIALFFFVL